MHSQIRSMTSPFSFYFSSLPFALYLLPQQPPIHSKTETVKPSYCTHRAARFKDILQLYLLIQIFPCSTELILMCKGGQCEKSHCFFFEILHKTLRIGELLFTHWDIFCFISALWWPWWTIQPDRHFLWTVSSTGREHYRDQPSCGILFWRTEY